MKGFKKLLTGILAATMIMGASLTAFAADTASISITNDKVPEGETAQKITYTYYQILKADIATLKNDSDSQNGADQSGSAAYYVTSYDLQEALAATNYFDIEESATETRWNVKLKDGITVSGADLANALNTDAIKNNAIATGTFDNTKGDEIVATATKTGLEPGYYLVLSSLGTVAAVQTIGDVEINEKNTYPTVTKAETKDHDSMYDDADPVVYTIEVDVPESVNKSTITVYDVASKGLTLNKEVVVKFADKTTSDAYSWSDGKAREDGKFVYELTLSADDVYNHRGQKITLTYTAIVNDQAVIYVPEENSAYIKYDNYTSTETQPVEVVTVGVQIEKIDGATGKPLSGAEFTLWTAETNGEKVHLVLEDAATHTYRVASADEIKELTEDGIVKSVNVVVGEDGKALIRGLDSVDKYYLQEEVAPAGYNKLATRKAVIFENTTSLKVAKIENNQGSVLPSTGGIGTTIFYILGGILIIAGVAYFMVRRKANAN